MAHKRPLILGIGGTLRNGSSSERALSIALQAAEQEGADVQTLTGSSINSRTTIPGTKQA